MRNATLTSTLAPAAAPTAVVVRRVGTRPGTPEDALLAALQRVNRVREAAGRAVARLLGEALRQLSGPALGRRLAVLGGGGFGAAPLEMLEGRQLFSAASVTFSGGVLTVTGNAGAGTNLSVQPAGDGRSLTGNAGGGHVLTVAASGVKKVVVTGGTGADTIYIDRTVMAPVSISGNGGSDVVRGGGGVNTISLGNGNAWVSTRGTAAYVKAGDGNVTLLGGSGNDTLVGGNGNDSIDGAGGNDSMVAGNGNDTIMGDSGNDTMVTGNGTDVIYGGLGNDKIATGTGKTTIYAGSGANTIVSGSSRTVVADHSGSNTISGPSSSSGPSSPTATPTPTPTATPASGTVLSPTWVTYSAPSAVSGGPQAVIQIMDPAAMVGSGVAVRALNSNLGVGSVIDANFVWNFGDSSGAHNSMSGFNAGHVYDTPGTYTLSLTVTNTNGKSSTATAKVNIGADTRTKVYVNAQTGNDANNGSSTGSAVKTPDRAADLVDDGTEILFARGQQFNVHDGIGLKYSNVLVGAYGSGADPVLNYADQENNSVLFTTNGGSAVGVTIQNLSLISGKGTALADQDDAANGINAGGYANVVRDCTFTNLAYDVDAVGSPVGLLVEDNDSPSAIGLNGYFVWGAGATDLTVVGNTVAGTVHEHVVRTTGTDEENLSDNDFTNTDGKGCIEMHEGSYIWVDGNTVTSGDIRVGPRGGDTEAATTKDAYAVIQNNTVRESDVEIDPGSLHVMIRNNVVTKSTGGDCYMINGQDSSGRQNVDVRLINNTGYETANSGQFLQAYNYTNGVQLINNLYVAPTMAVGSQGTAPVYIDADSTAGFTTITNNVWQTPATTTRWSNGGINFLAASYVSDGELTAAEWNALSVVGGDVFATTSINTSSFKPSSNSAAATAGKIAAGVYGDMNGNDRPTSGSWSAGAVQV